MLFILCTLTSTLSESTTIIFNQTSKEHYFSLKDFNLSLQPLSITLRQLSSPASSTLLTARKNLAPSSNSTTENWEILADLYDYNTWVSKSKIHLLQLPKHQDWFLGIYTYEFYNSIQWILSIKPLEENQCIDECNLSGKCKNNQCFCYEGWVGNDCSILIIKGTLNNMYEILVRAESYIYLSMNFNHSIDCKIEKNEASLFLFTKTLGTGISDVTGRLDYETRENIAYGITKKICSIPKLSLLVSSQKIFIECDNSSSTSTQKSSTIMWILLGVACIVIIVWVILAFLRCCRINSKSKIVPQLKIILKNEKFPVICYKEMSKKEEDTCSICQIKFEIQSTVRVLECGHFYHKDCIDEWFQTQKNCCICKKEYNDENYYEHNEEVSRQNLLGPDHENESFQQAV